MSTEVVMQVFHFSRYSALYCEQCVMLLLRRALAFSRKCFFTTASAVSNCACTCDNCLCTSASQSAQVSDFARTRGTHGKQMHTGAWLFGPSVTRSFLGAVPPRLESCSTNVLAPAPESSHSLPSPLRTWGARFSLLFWGRNDFFT